MTSKRYLWVDISKGIAIFFVVVGHVIVGLSGAGIATDDGWRLLHNMIYSFHMPLFFMMSGFFMINSMKGRSLIKFVGNKFDTIFYPYVIWMVLQAAAIAMVAQYTNGNESASWGDVLKLYPAKDQFWFLYHLMLMMVVTLIVVKLMKIHSLLLLFFSVAMYFYFGGVGGDLDRFSAFYCYFLIGVVLGRNMPYLYRAMSNVFFLFFLLFFFVLSQYLMSFRYNLRYDSYGLATLAVALVSSGFILSVSVQLAKVGFDKLEILGQASMLIFLGHILTGSGVRIAMQKLMGINEIWMHFTVGVLMGIVPWLIVYKLSLRYGFLKNLYQIKYFSKNT